MAHFSEEGFEEDPGDSVQIESPVEENESESFLENAVCLCEARRSLRLCVNQVHQLTFELELRQQRLAPLRLRLASVGGDAARLRSAAFAAEDDVRDALAGFHAYRQKMLAYRVAVAGGGRELTEKRHLVQSLKQQRDELEEDLKNMKREVEALKEEAREKRSSVSEWSRRLQEELRAQELIRRTIQIQARRHEAVVKRLRLQLSRAQDAHRRRVEEIFIMRKTVAELKSKQKLLELPQSEH